jgi:hypothetical protein
MTNAAATIELRNFADFFWRAEIVLYLAWKKIMGAAKLALENSDV